MLQIIGLTAPKLFAWNSEKKGLIDSEDPFHIFTFRSLVGVVSLVTGFGTHTQGAAVWFLAGTRDVLFSRRPDRS